MDYVKNLKYDPRQCLLFVRMPKRGTLLEIVSAIIMEICEYLFVF